ncbi:MAG: hypothetical protein IT379_39375 [Deltaproteobacteria bacterium]|nr:hypothetical protein [Deltaproteobacteria bacterium]
MRFRVERRHAGGIDSAESDVRAEVETIASAWRAARQRGETVVVLDHGDVSPTAVSPGAREVAVTARDLYDRGAEAGARAGIAAADAAGLGAVVLTAEGGRRRWERRAEAWVEVAAAARVSATELARDEDRPAAPAEEERRIR